MTRICYSTESKLTAVNANDRIKPERVSNQKVIDKLFDLGTINDEQYYAAERLWKDYYHANFYKMLKSKSFAKLSKEKNYKSHLEGVIEARQRFERARALLTSIEVRIVEFVVLSDRYLKYYNSLNGAEPIALNLAYNILRQGLDVLSKYYKVKNNDLK